MKEKAGLDELYDVDTEFSRKTMAQIRWDDKIKSELKKLARYESF